MDLELDFDLDPFVETGLVRMYAACGMIIDARQVFDKMSTRDVVAWSIMINGYCKSGDFDAAFDLFEEMTHSDAAPDPMRRFLPSFFRLVGVLGS